MRTEGALAATSERAEGGCAAGSETVVAALGVMARVTAGSSSRLCSLFCCSQRLGRRGGLVQG